MKLAKPVTMKKLLWLTA